MSSCKFNSIKWTGRGGCGLRGLFRRSSRAKQVTQRSSAASRTASVSDRDGSLVVRWEPELSVPVANARGSPDPRNRRLVPHHFRQPASVFQRWRFLVFGLLAGGLGQDGAGRRDRPHALAGYRADLFLPIKRFDLPHGIQSRQLDSAASGSLQWECI